MAVVPVVGIRSTTSASVSSSPFQYWFLPSLGVTIAYVFPICLLSRLRKWCTTQSTRLTIPALRSSYNTKVCQWTILRLKCSGFTLVYYTCYLFTRNHATTCGWFKVVLWAIWGRQTPALIPAFYQALEIQCALMSPLIPWLSQDFGCRIVGVYWALQAGLKA